jgi:hypothetical protein
MYTYRKDPMYPAKYLTIDEIESSHKVAQKLRAQAFMSFVTNVFARKETTPVKLINTKMKTIYADGIAK